MSFRPISHRLMSALLLCALLWQALALLFPLGQAAAAEHLAHRFIHAEAVTHQHEIDAALALDPLQDSAFHLHEHDAGQPFALLAAVFRTPQLSAPSQVHSPGADAMVSVFLEGPLRPPCLPV